MMMLITSHQQRLELLKPKHTQVNAEWPEIKVVARPDNLRRDAIFTSNGKKNFDSDFILKQLEKGIDISISQKMSPIKKQSSLSLSSRKLRQKGSEVSNIATKSPRKFSKNARTATA